MQTAATFRKLNEDLIKAGNFLIIKCIDIRDVMYRTFHLYNLCYSSGFLLKK